MKKTSLLALLPWMLASTSIAWAATEITSTNFSENSARMIVTDNHLVTLQSDPSQYLIMDLKTGEHLSVFTNDKVAVEMSALPEFNKESLFARAALPKRAKFTLKHIEKGPIIAGYPTEKYQILADATLCAETWLSVEAMEKAKLQHFLTQFSKHSTKQREAYLSAGTEYEACDDALGRASEEYPKLGLAMRTKDKSGTLMQEVTSINLNVAFDTKAYLVTKDYERMTFEEFIRRDNANADSDDTLIDGLQ